MVDIVRFTDTTIQRMHKNELRELMLNMNTNGTGDETWFDEEIPIAYTEEIDDVEFFERYFNMSE